METSLTPRKDKNMWLDRLKELKKETGMSLNQIADATNLPDKTIDRIFSGKTTNPYVDTLHRIVSVLGGSLDDILADTKAVVGPEKLATLQENVDATTAELDVANAEIAVLKDKVANLTAENDILRIKLELKEEMLAIHNYYIRRKDNE